MKICSPQLGLNPNSSLGGEVHDHFVLQGLANQGNRILVYLPKGRHHLRNKNIIVSYAPFMHIPAFLFNILILPYLFSTYRKEKFDILRIHSPYFVGPGALIFKLFHPKIKTVATYHLQESSFFFDLINRLTIKRYDKIITVSNFLKNWLIKKYKIDPTKISVIYNAVDKKLIPQPKDKILVKKYKLENKVVLLFMGLLIERKNPMLLLKIFKDLAKTHKNIALLICGNGPLECKIKNFIRDNAVKDVTLTGSIISKSKYFNLSDIFILPSKNEGFGLVIGEAMACSKPVVITNAWSASEAVTSGKEGFLAKDGDERDWKQKLEKLITDSNLRKKMGQNGRKKAQQTFSWHKVVPEHERLLFKLIKNEN